MSDRYRVAYIDIENSPNLAWVWAKYQQDALAFKEEWHILSFAVKWGASRRVECYALPDFALYKKEPDNDRELIKRLWGVLDEADLVVTHNGDKFDLRKANARFIQQGLGPPSPYQTVDTLKVARKHFAFTSNKLGDLCEVLGIGAKVKHEGFGLWRACMAGDAKAWARMKRYNARDVVLTERLHQHLRAWHTGHPNVAIKSDRGLSCPRCGSSRLMLRGWRYSKLRRARSYYCRACKAWPHGGYGSIPGVTLVS